MISIEKINADMIDRIGKVYPKVPFTAQEKIEDIARPAFKLILDEIRSERYTTGAVKRTFPVELVYFAADTQRPKLECLSVYEDVEAVLLGVADNLSAAVNTADAVLVVDFELTEIGGRVELYEDGDYIGSDELMENLELTEEINDVG